ncbi:MFS transporter [Janthinobacterium sp. RB2R34]|uniref:MFS transporter n=1 Tax=Janthinobacterium sp. RB2R34 TaxID=3424193 RepID=UPI003F268AC7
MQTSTVTPAARGALAALSLATLLPALGASIANIGVPAIAASLQAPFKQVQWVVLAYLLAVTALSVNAGRLGDRLGRRRLLLAGIALFAVASLLCALATSLPLLVAARIVQGAGAAVMLALAMAMAAGAVSRQRAGSAMGLLGSMSALGTTLGPALGGLLLARYGWPSLFLVNLPLAALALLLAWRYLPEDRQAPSVQPAHLALRIESALAAGLLASALVSTVMMTTLVVGPFYLARGLQLGSTTSGLVLALGPLAAALCGVPAGRLVDRHGAQRMLKAGLLCAVLACLALALLPASLSVAAYALPLVLLTAGYALFQAANNTAMMMGVAAGRRGSVAGAMSLSRNLGLVAGASVMAGLFALAAGGDVTTAPGEAVARGMHAAFAVAAVVLLAALAIARRGGQPHKMTLP